MSRWLRSRGWVGRIVGIWVLCLVVVVVGWGLGGRGEWIFWRGRGIGLGCRFGGTDWLFWKTGLRSSTFRSRCNSRALIV